MKFCHPYRCVFEYSNAFLFKPAGQFTFSSVFALIANSVQPDVLGSVNGLGQMLVALFRMIGPVVAGPVYFWSINPPYEGVRAWPFNYWLGEANVSKNAHVIYSLF